MKFDFARDGDVFLQAIGTTLYIVATAIGVGGVVGLVLGVTLFISRKGAISARAGELGMTVVAEGVENNAQLDYLLEAGVDAVQGYLHTRPMHEKELLDWLLEQKKMDWSADYHSKRK